MTNPPTLPATLQPQHWINDHAVDSAPAISFNAAPILLAMTLAEFAHVVGEVFKSSGRDLDLVGERSGELVDHSGPYYVDIAPAALTEFLVAVGLTGPLTESSLAAARAGMSVAAVLQTSIMQSGYAHGADGAQIAITAYGAASGIDAEGNIETTIWHLLAGLLDFCKRNKIDFNALVNEVGAESGQ